MAYTKLTDVIVPEVFNEYFINRTAEKANFYLGGIITNNSELNKLASTGGTTINMPFFNDLSGDAEALSDSTPLTVNNITTAQDKARLQMLGKAFGANDLAKALSGADPMGAIGELVADYWARQYQGYLLSSLSGVLASNVAGTGDMVVDVASEDADTDGVKFDADLFIDGQATFGDSIRNVTGIAMHPDTYYGLLKTDNISFERESMGDLVIETYRGLRVIVDRNLPKVAGATSGNKYTTVLFGDGAFGFGQGGAPVPTETDRDTLQGTDVLITRSHFIMHPMGVKWNEASVAGLTPTKSELADATNWTRVYEREQVRIAYVLHN